MISPTSSSRLAVREYPKDALPLMEQKWRDLLFLHWEYDPAEIQKSLPKGLYVDMYEGKAYIGLIPFFMKDIKLKLLPSIPGLSNCLEMNLRTYVYDELGTPGVWFYSLDADSFLGVQLANSIYHLPYFYAEMSSHLTSNNEIMYHCQRQQADDSMEFIYQSKGKTILAEPDSLEFFLIERYLLFAYKGDNQLATARVHHTPYPISEADVVKWDDKVFEWDGLKKPLKDPDHICFSSGVDVEIFSLKDISRPV